MTSNEEVIISGVLYRVLGKSTPDEIQDKAEGLADAMRKQGIDYQITVTNPRYPITYGTWGQPSNIMLAYQKGDATFWHFR